MKTKLKRLLKNIVLPLSQRQTPAGELVTTPAAETAAVRWKSLLMAALCAVGMSAFAAPEAVQLWKDGPYFATCNVGAEKPADYGILTNFGNAAQAVTDAMGDGWRLPTQGELEKLIDDSYCTRSWDGDRKVLIFTGKGDYAANGICLPAAGYKDDGEFKKLGAYGRYWTSSTYGSYDAYRLHFEGGGSIWVSSDARVYHLSLRAVRDTPPVTVSAVSEEGWIDLTVGDRVAKAEELVVVDPAWGEAASATVDFTFGASTVETRTYNCASNDLWDTTTLTPGRYTLALTAGATNETAAFWKTGAGWEVLDNSQYNEGIEFQAGTTYLVLNAATVPDDKTLKVVDGAKFEYGEGAGFKGGKLEAPRRYRKEVVEGDLYRIVEAIKGCEDNPWVAGGDASQPENVVEAYTNGNELVIVGAGTIADLSEIPADVKGGIAAITVAEVTVKGAADGAFTGFSNIALTLPDNWQGELPEKGAWYGATGVELTRMPMAVRNVKVQQRYPWNGKVDIKFALTGEGDVKVKLLVTVDGKPLAKPTVTGAKKFDLRDGGELKGLRFIWDAGADFGDAELHKKIKVKLSVSPAESD